MPLKGNLCLKNKKNRDVEGQHGLVTRTEAKSEFLLKDCDLDLREPSLRYITRKNPQRSHWSEMKLYLRLQVHQLLVNPFQVVKIF